MTKEDLRIIRDQIDQQKRLCIKYLAQDIGRDHIEYGMRLRVENINGYLHNASVEINHLIQFYPEYAEKF